MVLLLRVEDAVETMQAPFITNGLKLYIANVPQSFCGELIQSWQWMQLKMLTWLLGKLKIDG